MKKSGIYLFLLLSLLINSASAQLLLPKFSEPVKQVLFSSDNEESSPLPFNMGKGIYYNRTYISGTDENLEITGNDFWISTMSEKGWKKPYRVLREGDIPGNNLLIGTSKNGNRMYLLNTLIDKKEFVERLVFVDKVGKNKWSDPVEIVIPGFTIKPGFIHFYVNPEETAMLISMPPNDNVQEEDIFVSLKDTLTDKWGSLINLGKTINTRRYELGSFLSRDLKTLYFSSEGHGGFGASDIFVSYRLNDSWTEWTEPLNLGEPINSKDYEAYYVVANNKEVYFVSDRGDKHNSIFKATATGELVFANDSVKGKFTFRGLPMDNITLVIEDEFGNIVDELITDEFGNFQFAKLDKLSSKYVIKLKEKDKEKYIGSKIYLLNNEGKQTERFVFTDEKEFTGSNELKKDIVYDGVFNYKKLPSINSGLVIIDENSFPIDTIFTDENGQFAYQMSKYDVGITIRPLNVTKEEYKDVELIVMNKKANSLYRVVPGEYQELILKEVVAKNPPGVDPIIKETNDPSKDPVSKLSKRPKELKVIRFNLNQYSITEEGKEVAMLLVEMLKTNSKMQVELVGHTDNSGNKTTNMNLGKLRAEAIKTLLVSNGISKDRIRVTSKGDTEPMASNDTREGRMKNRRVELKVR